MLDFNLHLRRISNIVQTLTFDRTPCPLALPLVLIPLAVFLSLYASFQGLTDYYAS